MLKKVSTDTLNWIIIIGVILFIIEIAFFGGGAITGAIISGLLFFVGWKNYSYMWGKVLFWIGLVWLIFAIFNMIAVRFLIVALLILLLMDYMKSKQNPKRFEPTVDIDGNKDVQEPVVRLHPLLRQILYGDESTENQAYEW